MLLKIKLLCILLIISLTAFAGADQISENSQGHNEVTFGIGGSYYSTFSGNAVQMNLGIRSDYRALAFSGLLLDALDYRLFFGGKSGFLFNSSAIAKLTTWGMEKEWLGKTEEYAPKHNLLPLMFAGPYTVPLHFLVEGDIVINEFVSIKAAFSGGPDLCIYPGTSPYFLYSGIFELGTKLFFTPKWGIDISLHTGIFGHGDFWPGFGIYMSSVSRI